MADTMKALTNEQRKLCERALDRNGVALDGACIHSKATQMVIVKYSSITIPAVAYCDKCTAKVKRESKKYGYTVITQKIV